MIQVIYRAICDKCGCYLCSQGKEDFEEDEIDDALAREGWIETELGNVCEDCVKNNRYEIE